MPLCSSFRKSTRNIIFNLPVKGGIMQATGKADSTDSSVTKMRLRNLNSKKFTTPKLLGLFTCILTTGLMVTTGSIRAEPHMMFAATSELENTERNVRDRGDTKKLTPENQKATRSDRQITAAIRAELLSKTNRCHVTRITPRLSRAKVM